jgi:hypothetical protein
MSSRAKNAKSNLKFLRMLETAKPLRVSSGIVDKKMNDRGMPYSELLYIHAHGYITSPDSAVPNSVVPARPLIRMARKKHQKEWVKTLSKDFRKAMNQPRSGKVHKTFNKVGKLMTKHIKAVRVKDLKVIRNGAYKQRNNPLSLTGGLHRNLKHKVHKKDKVLTE